MREDPIVDEARRTRLEIEKECEEDFELIHARAVEVQKKTPAKLVSRPGTVKMPEIDRKIAADRKKRQ